MIAVFIALVAAVALGAGSWRADQRWFRSGTPLRAGPAAVLLMIGAGVCTFIQAMLLLEVQGAYGPVQYWPVETATDMTGPRMLAGVAILLGVPLAVAVAIATVVSFVTPSDAPRWRRAILPAASLASLALASHGYDYYGILPTA